MTITTTNTRTVRLTQTDGGLALVIRQQTGKQAIQVDAYFLTQAADGYTLSKVDMTSYTVRLAGTPACSCKGHQRWGHCKHAESLLALQSAGKLPKSQKGVE